MKRILPIIALLILWDASHNVNASSGQSAGTLNAYQMSQQAATTKKNLVWVDDANRVWKMDSMTYAGSKDLDDTAAVLRALIVPIDTVPSGNIMTKFSAENAISAIENDISTKQPYSDTATWDATKYWVGQQISGKADISEIPTNVSQLVNDVPYLSSVSWSQVSGKPDLSLYATKSTTLTINNVTYDLSANRTWSFDKSTMGLSNVDNTSDLNKPISTATQTALNGKFSTPSGTTAQYIRGDGSLATFPTIPAQINPTAGTNMSITGSYPNLTFNASATSVPIRNKAGQLATAPVFFTDTFSVSTSTPTIDLSTYITAAGKTTCKVVSAVAYRVGAITSNSPNVTITGMTNTSVSLILNQTNTATVSILSINVLSGLPTILTPDPTNVKVVIGAYFY